MTLNEKSVERIYGQWVGNRKGTPENKLNCIEKVTSNWIFSHNGKEYDLSATDLNYAVRNY